MMLRDHECITILQHSIVHGSAKPAGSQQWCYGCAEWREDELFTELPAALRAEVAGVLLLGTLRGIPTFAECDPLPTQTSPLKTL